MVAQIILIAETQLASHVVWALRDTVSDDTETAL